MLEDAIEIALKAHKGQKDKAGKPYILHPLRVMSQMDTETEMMCAVLHDVLEDSNESITSMPSIVRDAVEKLTKRPEQAYEEYIENISHNKIATKVKLADLKDNMNLSRLDEITKDDIDRVIFKYNPAYHFLCAAIQE